LPRPVSRSNLAVDKQPSQMSRFLIERSPRANERRAAEEPTCDVAFLARRLASSRRRARLVSRRSRRDPLGRAPARVRLPQVRDALLDVRARPERGRGTPGSALCARQEFRRGSPAGQPESFAPTPSVPAAASSACRPWSARRRAQLALESIEQVEEAHALPRAVSPPDSRLPKDSCSLEPEDRLACTLFGTSKQLRSGLHIDYRVRR
jgi:hypothetical protein